MSYDLKIKPLPTSKSKVKQRALMEQGIIPAFATSTIIVGKSGSGKSCLLGNLLLEPHFYGVDGSGKPYYDICYVFSKTAGAIGCDDTYKNIPWLSEVNFINDLDGSYIDQIIEIQKKDIKKNGYEKAKKGLLIFDDVLSEPKFLKSKSFKQIFCDLRHFACSVIVNTQHFTGIPKPCRTQCMNLFYFAGSMEENECVAEHTTPPNLNKRQYIKCIQDCTNDPYGFMYINTKQPIGKRVRKNLDQLVNMEYYKKL